MNRRQLKIFVAFITSLGRDECSGQIIKKTFFYETALDFKFFPETWANYLRLSECEFKLRKEYREEISLRNQISSSFEACIRESTKKDSF